MSWMHTWKEVNIGLVFNIEASSTHNKHNTEPHPAGYLTINYPVLTSWHREWRLLWKSVSQKTIFTLIGPDALSLFFDISGVSTWPPVPLIIECPLHSSRARLPLYWAPLVVCNLYSASLYMCILFVGQIKNTKILIYIHMYTFD